MLTKAIDFLKKFSKVFIVFFLIVGLFVFYNIFLIDRTLEELKFSLGQTALAYDIKDTDGLDILLTMALSEEIGPQKMDSQNIMNLEFARNVVSEGKSYKQLENIRFALGAVINQKERKRGVILQLLDKINYFFRQAFAKFSRLSFSFFKRKSEPLSPTALILLNRAKEIEKEMRLEEAAGLYRDFLQQYPKSEKAALAKLRLAYCLHRQDKLDEARKIYREVARDYPTEKETDIAQALLYQLGQRDKLLVKKNALMARLSELGEKEEEARQKVCYELGVLNIQLFNYDEAKKFFQRAHNILAAGELGLKALFNSAWISKQNYEMEKSLSEFQQLIEEKSVLVLDSNYQVADIYHKEGRYKEAIEIYVKLADSYKGDPVAPLCLFQAGASYMYDLNDDQKAKEMFAKLTKDYPSSTYAKYLAPESPAGLFITYFVPRATRIVAWRAGGLLALTGYSGEISKFRVRAEENAFNRVLKGWIKSEVPDAVGNLYVDIREPEVQLLSGKARGKGMLTLGKFNIKTEGEGKLELTKEGSVNLAMTKIVLENIPIPPVLIINTLAGLTLMGRKYFPVIVTRLSMDKGEIIAEGYGSKRMLSRLKTGPREFAGLEKDITDILDPLEQDKVYSLFKERFPESDFSPRPKDDAKSLFLDFFTRTYLYLGFKLLETAKDIKLDYESVPTLGGLWMKKDKFKVTYNEEQINLSLQKLIEKQYPWLVNREYLFDLKKLKINFENDTDIRFQGLLNLGRMSVPVKADEIKEISIEGSAFIEIDKESKLPRLGFRDIFLNGSALSAEKLNLVSIKCLNLIKDGHLPLQFEEIKISGKEISLKGEGARDFSARVFNERDIFSIFEVRDWDLAVSGIRKVRQVDVATPDKGQAELERELNKILEPAVPAVSR